MGNLEKDKDSILELATLHFQGRITDEQSTVLISLLDKNEDNRIYYDEIHDAWIASSIYHGNDVAIDTDSSWISISKQIIQFPDNQKFRTIRHADVWLKIAKTAAFWLFLMALGAFATWFVSNRPLEVSTGNLSEITTPLGSRSSVRLPDGSKVWLNAGSMIRYSQNSFRRSREVYLEGEAYFDVSKKREKIFIVHTSDINIKVYGTQFNVRSYPEENEIQTTLVRGSVAIEDRSKAISRKEVFLKPNQTATFYKITESKPVIDNGVRTVRPFEKKDQVSKLVVIPELDPVAKASWKDDQWVIKGKNFGQLAIEMERRYNVNIAFKEESLKDFKFTGTLADETFEQVMKIIQLSAPIRFSYTVENNEVLLKYDENN